MFKKIIAVSTATMLTIAMSVSAFADIAGISDAERELINSLPQSLRADAEAKLKDKDVNLSQANAEALVSEVKALETYFKDELKVTSVDAAMEALKGDKAADIEAKITTVADVAKSAGITVDAAAIIDDIQSDKITSSSALSTSVSSKSTIDSAKANDTNNKPVVGLRDTTDPGKSSLGADFSTTAAVVAGLGIAVVGVAVVAKKKDLVNA